MSNFHFQRMFNLLTGYTVIEYIRNRRITVAAKELVHSNSKVIDIAFKYGYEMPESFTMAFQRIHGISPSSVRKHSKSLKAFTKLSFQIHIKSDVDIDYSIV